MNQVTASEREVDAFVWNGTPLRLLERWPTVLLIMVSSWIGLLLLSIWPAGNEFIDWRAVYLLAWGVPPVLITLHVIAHRRLRQRIAHARGRVCPACGYDLRGTCRIARCTECGVGLPAKGVATVWRDVVHAHGGSPGTCAFWRRQFSAHATQSQHIYDSLFGLFLPAVCLLFDPIAFRGEGMFLDARNFAYGAIAVSMLMLILVMAAGRRLPAAVAMMLTGGLAVAGSVAYAIGVVLFPFAVLGMIVLIGILGFTPLYTTFTYFRWTVKSWRQARSRWRNRPAMLTAFWLCAGAMLVGGGAIAADFILPEPIRVSWEDDW